MDDTDRTEAAAESTGIRWIFRQTKGSRLHLCLMAAAVVFMAGVNVAIAYVLKIFIDIAQHASDLSLADAMTAAGTLVFLMGALRIAINYCKAVATSRTEIKIRRRFMAKIYAGKLVAVQGVHTGDLLTRLTSDAQSVAACAPIFIENIFGSLFTAVVAAIALYLLNWKIALIITVTIPLLLGVLTLFNGPLGKANKTDKSNEEKNRRFLQEQLSRLVVIKSYRMGGASLERMVAMYADKYRSSVAFGIWEGVMMFFNVFIGTMMALISLGIGAYFVLQGETTIGTLIAIIQMMNHIITPFSQIATNLSLVTQAKISVARILEILRLPEDEVADTRVLQPDRIVLDGVRFSYKEGRPILNGVDLVLDKRSVVGIVGESGGGKSTLLKLLIGLYEPESGKVGCLKDGQYFEKIASGDVAYVPSHDFLFSGTIRDNICIGASLDEARMNDALEKVNLRETVRNMPEGCDTAIAEGGSSLSSGQAQRVAIARALYTDASVIVFDEPTSNLDVASIAIFKRTIQAIARDKICVIVSHDDGTMDVCDVIYRLEKGKIARVARRG